MFNQQDLNFSSIIFSLVKISDPSNNIYNVAGLRIEFKDINAKPPEPIIMKKLFNEAILSEHEQMKFNEKIIAYNGYNFSVNSKSSSIIILKENIFQLFI